MEYLNLLQYPLRHSQLKRYKYKHTDDQTSRSLKARLAILKLWKQINPAFTILLNSAGLPILVCENGTLKCTIYFDKKDYEFRYDGVYVVKFECCDSVNKLISNKPELSKTKKTHNKNRYYYVIDYVAIRRLAFYYSVEDFIKESASLSLVPDICRIIYSYLSF